MMEGAEKPSGFEKLKAKWREEAQLRQREADLRRAALVERGKPVFERFGVHHVVLFGSVARGRSVASSDLDLLVWPLSAKAYWDFKHALEEAVNYPCDIHTTDGDPGFVNKVRARGEMVYTREP